MEPRAELTDSFGLSDELRLAVLDNLSDGVYFVDRERRIQYWNKGAEEITGYAASEAIGRWCGDRLLSHCDETGRILCGDRCPLLETMRDGQPREAHVYVQHKDGHRRPVCIRAAPLHDADGHVIGAAEVFHDDSALVALRRQAADLRDASLRDPLTGVGNRRLAATTLSTWVDQHRRYGRGFGVLFADLDEFKSVNDDHGHDVGDEALQVVARTLSETVRDGDIVTRWGGEEFLILLAEADADGLRSVAERIRALVAQSRLIAGRRRVQLTVSIGGTLAAPGDTPELILRRADLLAYRSKASGRDRVTLDVPGVGPAPA